MGGGEGGGGRGVNLNQDCNKIEKRLLKGAMSAGEHAL